MVHRDRTVHISKSGSIEETKSYKNQHFLIPLSFSAKFVILTNYSLFLIPFKYYGHLLYSLSLSYSGLHVLWTVYI